MSFADWFKRDPKPAALGDMRDTLLALLARKDYAALMTLINDNSQAIRDAFSAWVRVPDAIRQQPAQLQAYASMLHMLASVFERAGDPSLMARLTGGNLM